MKKSMIFSIILLMSAPAAFAMAPVKTFPIGQIAAAVAKKGFGKTEAEIAANPNIVNNKGDTPLLFIAKNEGDSIYTQRITQNLINNGANINYVNPQDGSTPLLGALERGNFTLAEELIKAGANVNVATKKDGMTPLMFAARDDNNWFTEQDALVPLLIEHGADLNAKDKSGQTAKDYASEKNLPLIEKAMLKYGAKERLI